MSRSRPTDPGFPRPEELAAYVDGQLAPARRKGVEIWLRNHPEAAVEIEEQRRLAGLWQATTPGEPEEANWAGILTRVEGAYSRFRSARSRNRRLILIGAAGLAAGVLLMLWTPKAGEPLDVVSPDDVEIVSLRAADRVTLVVGVPPVQGPLVLASVGDVEVQGVEPAADGMLPSIHMDERSTTPMIAAPLDPAQVEAPDISPK